MGKSNCLSLTFAIIVALLLPKNGWTFPLMSNILPEEVLNIRDINEKTNKIVKSDSDTLIFVQTLWRHGDRTPTMTFKNDVNQEDSWPQGLGQLTTIGMEQHYNLGLKLRKKYIETDKFINPSYYSREVYVRSSNTNRTIISAISNFIGFYSNPTPGVDYPDIAQWPVGYVPVPVHANIPYTADYLINMDSHCPRRDRLMKKVAQTSEFKSMVEENKEFFKQLSDWTGTKITLSNIWSIRDVLMIEKIHNKNLPKWATKEVIEKILLLDEFQIKSAFGEGISSVDKVDFNELKVIRGGPLLQSWLGNMRQKVNCMKANDVEENTTKPNKECKWMNRLKYTVLSAHDLTLAALASVLGTEQDSGFGIGLLPTYATSVTLELWKSGKTNDFYIKFLLWLPSKDSYIDLTSKVTGCENGCTLEQFEERSQKFIPPIPIEQHCLDEDFSEDAKDSGIHFKSSYLLTNGLAGLATFFTLVTRRFI